MRSYALSGLAFTCLLTLAGCTGQPSGKSTVRIQLPQTAGLQQTTSTSTSSSGSWGLSAPASFSEISCFLITVGGPDDILNTHAIKTSDGTRTVKFGPFLGLAAAGKSISFEVPAGARRQFSLFGFTATNGTSDCQDLKNPLTRSKFSAPHLLASAIQDLTPSIQTDVLLHVAWDKIVAFDDSDIFLSSTGGGGTLLTAADVTTSEWGLVTIPITLSQAYSSPVTLVYTTNDDTALAGTDYVSTSAAIEIPAGATSAKIAVPLMAHYDQYVPRRFKVLVNGTISGTSLSATSTVTISGSRVGLLVGTGFSQVSLGPGGRHGCAVQNGVAKCWGENNYGQLGIGSQVGKPVATAVSILGNNVTQVDVGTDHSCALVAGAVYCWGRNESGQLGDGTQTMRTVPTLVPGLSSGVAKIAVGNDHGCAILSTTGELKCWGANASGQLGDGTTTMRLSPVAVNGGLTGTAQVSAGAIHTCAVMTSGPLKCWGGGGTGQLGTGTTSSSLTPTTISSGTNFSQVSAGVTHTCAITSAGAAQCWGNGADGRIGNGSTANQLTPTNVIASGAADISAGNNHTCARLTSGKVQCWGRNNHGQAGDGTFTDRMVPTDTVGITSGASDLATGSIQSCAVLSSGELRCWGYNYAGQLGDGFMTLSTQPTVVSGISDAVDITTGLYHTCARTNSGSAYCWGAQNSLGSSVAKNLATPTLVTGLTSGVTAIGAGANHTCAVVSGAVKCWGSGDNGVLGNGGTTASITPVSVTGLSTTATNVIAGMSHSCALLTSKTMQCWGNNDYGQLGTGNTISTTAATTVTGLSDVIQITSGAHHTCALQASGTVLCWGKNTSGELGDGLTSNSPTPQAISLGGTAMRVVAGSQHTCALMTSGSVKCWGSNSFGQLGVGSGTTTSLTPVAITLAGPANEIISGSTHTCVRSIADSSLSCWGRNDYGQTGRIPSPPVYLPAAVPTLASNVLAMASGSNSNHSCVVAQSTVLCWGFNYGLESGVWHGRPTPRAVLTTSN